MTNISSLNKPVLFVVVILHGKMCGKYIYTYIET